MPPPSSMSISKLPRLSNQQWDETLIKAKDYNISFKVCPTCRSTPVEIEEDSGMYAWPESTYKLGGVEYPCDCEEQIKLARHYLLANIPPDYWRLSDAEFVGDSQALTAANNYIANYENLKQQGIGINFWSQKQGTGKTMLACVIAKELVKQGESVYFIHFDEAIRMYQMPYEKREEFERRLRRTPVLVLDEVSKPQSDAQRNFFATELESLIRHRTSGNAVTVLTTNIIPVNFEHDYPRVGSLLARATIDVSVSGEDIRKEGTIDLYRMELALNGETQKIT